MDLMVCCTSYVFKDLFISSLYTCAVFLTITYIFIFLIRQFIYIPSLQHIYCVKNMSKLSCSKFLFKNW